MSDDGVVRFLVLNKRGQMTFPPTKFRPGETLYTALVRTMEGNLGSPPGPCFPETDRY